MTTTEGLHRDRRVARAAGYATYFTGLACYRGHLSPRSTRNAKCLECVAAEAVKKAHEKAKVAAEEYRKRNARKLRAEHARDLAKEAAREAKKAALRVAREARAKERTKAKAAATRAAKKV